MNILHISPDFNYSCGVSKHIYLLLKEFKKVDNTKIYFITNRGDAIQRIKNIGIEISLMKFERGNRNPFIFIFFVFHLFLYCVKNKIDVIHTHHRVPELASVIVSKILNIKTVTTVHSLVNGWKNLSFKSDKIVCVSNFVKNNLINRFHVRSNKIILIYNFVEYQKNYDTDKISEIRRQKNLEITDFIIAFFGRIGFQKGTDVLIKAFKLLKEENKTVKLLLAGIIEDKDIISMIQNDDRIIYVGIVKDVENYYFLSSIVVMPSREDQFPYAMLEAGMMNKPFIGGRTGGIAEFIEDGIDGLLVEPGNVDELHNKLSFVSNNFLRAKEMGEKLFVKVNKFLPSAKEYISRLKTIYENL